MRQRFFSLLIVLLICSSVFAQKITESYHLGSWVAGEDSSEFINHNIFDTTEALLKENPKSRFIVLLCNKEDFFTSFIKSPLNPVIIKDFNKFFEIPRIPYEKIFVAKSSKCLIKNKYIQNQFWLVPDGIDFNYEEIVSANDITYKEFIVEDYDFDKSLDRNFGEMKLDFERNLKDFISELKSNPSTMGFIVHNSKRTKMLQNINEVSKVLINKKIDLSRVKVIKRETLEVSNKLDLEVVNDDKKLFPELIILTLKSMSEK